MTYENEMVLKSTKYKEIKNCFKLVQKWKKWKWIETWSALIIFWNNMNEFELNSNSSEMEMLGQN